MTDRLTLIMELGAVATDAAQRGDDRAAQTCRAAAELLFADKSAVDELLERKRIEEERRRHDRERKHGLRIPRKSKEGADIGGFQTASQGFSPTPPFPNPPDNNDNTTASAKRKRSGEDADYLDAVDRLEGMLIDRIGTRLWNDVSEFLSRRPFETWKGWLSEMLTVITGGQATPEDLAQVCRDDAALERPIGSPKGLRKFVGSALRERTESHRPQNGSGVHREGPAERSFRKGIAALEGL